MSHRSGWAVLAAAVSMLVLSVNGFSYEKAKADASPGVDTVSAPSVKPNQNCVVNTAPAAQTPPAAQPAPAASDSTPAPATSAPAAAVTATSVAQPVVTPSGDNGPTSDSQLRITDDNSTK